MNSAAILLCIHIDFCTDRSEWFSHETALDIVVGREMVISAALDDCRLDAEVELVQSWQVSKDIVTQLYTIDVVRIQSGDSEKQREFFQIDQPSKEWNDDMIEVTCSWKRNQSQKFDVVQRCL